MSDVRCQMSDVRFHISYCRCQMSDVRCQMSDARCQMSDLRCQALNWKKSCFHPSLSYDKSYFKNCSRGTRYSSLFNFLISAMEIFFIIYMKTSWSWRLIPHFQLLTCLLCCLLPSSLSTPAKVCRVCMIPS